MERTHVALIHDFRRLVDTRAMSMHRSPEEEIRARELAARRTARDDAAPSVRERSGLDVLGLQRTAGNSATGRLLTGLRVATAGRTLHRAIIPSAGIDGLFGNLDTSNLDASKAQIDQMWNGGKRKGLAELYIKLRKAPVYAHHSNNEALQTYVKRYLDKKREDDPLAGNSGFWEHKSFDFFNDPADETGITQMPGQAEQLPAHPTLLQTSALAVRSWQIGDIVDGVSWSTLGKHLTGRLSQQNYVDLGDGILARRDLLNGTNLQATSTNPQKEQVARASCQRVSQEIRVGLGNLPVTPGVSYRAATAAVGVYGSSINVGDLVKDMSFWSTAGLRQGHTGSDFGSDGTLQAPKVYYVINGSTGVFLPKFTNKEVGVREALYKDQTIFRVSKITNYADRTFFVWVDEVDPATLAPNPVTRNPWSGAVNP
jgi:hypothetical protein